MKIVLLYCDVGAPSRSLRLAELAMLSQLLCDAGFDAKIELLGRFDAVGESTFSVPDAQVLAFFLDEWNWPTAARCAQRMRPQSRVTTFLAFGIYASVAPENVLRSGNFQLLIAGEWEPAFLELANSLKRGKDVPPLRNVWEFRSLTDIRRTPLRPVIESLDTLPIWDHSLAKLDWELPPDDCTLYLWASRGCTFDCSFCYLPAFQRAYAGKERFRRQRSPAHVAGELLSEIRRSNYSYIVFVDEIFPTNKEWLRGLLKHLRGLSLPPWEANVAAEEVDKECFSLLQEAGCRKLNLGVETGNEAFRRRLGNRNISNDALREFCKLASEHDIAVAAHVMVSLPRENESLFNGTLSLLKELELAEIHTRRYLPIEKTPLGEYARPHMTSESAPDANPLPSSDACGFGLVSMETIRQFERQLDLLNLERLSRALPERAGLPAVDLTKKLSSANIAIEREGRLLVRTHIGPDGTQAVLIVQPALAIAFPRMSFPRNTLLRLSIALPEKTRRCLTATKATLLLRIFVRDNKQDHTLFEKTFDGRHDTTPAQWQELILPLPVQVEAGDLVFVTHCSRDDFGADTRLWIAEPALIQEATFIIARDKEQRLREDMTGQLEAVQKKLEKTQNELAQALEREKQLAEECDRKTKRLTELHVQMLELEKRCEELEQALAHFQSHQPIWKRLLGRTQFWKKR